VDPGHVALLVEIKRMGDDVMKALDVAGVPTQRRQRRPRPPVSNVVIRLLDDSGTPRRRTSHMFASEAEAVRMHLWGRFFDPVS
jgi:hypothetical protein